MLGVREGEAGAGAGSARSQKPELLLVKDLVLWRSSGGGVAVVGKQVEQWMGLSWVQRMFRGPWVSQKCARESWRWLAVYAKGPFGDSR